MNPDLRAVLALYPPTLQPQEEPDSLGNAGGFSGSRFWRFSSTIGLVAPRSWPPDGPPRERLIQIHAWLREIASLSFIPAPFAARDGCTLHEQGGCLWELTPWLPGVSADQFPPDDQKICAAFQTLARVHTALGRHGLTGASPGLAARRSELEMLSACGLAQLENAVDRATSDPSAPLARRWLTEARPRLAGVLRQVEAACPHLIRIQPCLRDARPQHFLFVEERVTGLIDFGAMGMESVAADLSRLATEWPGMDAARRQLAFEAYRALRPIDPIEEHLVRVFDAAAAFLVGAHWLRWHFLEGRTFDDSMAFGRGLARALNRLSALDDSGGLVILPGGRRLPGRP